ncbi:MAG: hypothetical protein KC609_04510 [Myxococcales bacterium]|nr:hypothetical protein [Myxococcales bacterium]
MSPTAAIWPDFGQNRPDFPDKPDKIEPLGSGAPILSAPPNDVVVVSLSALIAMKERTGRPVDQQDVEALRRPAEEQDD